MHRPATLLVLLALALAGCAEETATPAGDASGRPASDADAPPSDADLAAVDPGSAPHAHDLWDGRERITVLEQDFTVEPVEAVEWGALTTLFIGEATVGGFFVDLPEGQLVPEGTGRVEVLASWSDPTISGLRFLYRHAGSGDVQGWVKAPQGQPAPIEVTPEMSDMPHTPRTRWAFAFAADGAPPTVIGTVHLRIDAVRTRDPAVYPGHPDLWNGAAELVRLDAEGKTTTDAVPLPFPSPGEGFTPDPDALELDAPVPMETATLVVRVDVQGVEPAGTRLRGLRLEYRTAAHMVFDFEETDVQPQVSADGLSYEWRLPVKMEHTDSPYAEGSAWAILVQPEVEPPVPAPLPCDCGEVTLRYHARVSALKLPEPAPATEKDGPDA